VNEEGGRGRRDHSVSLDWISRVARILEARRNGPRSVVKAQARGEIKVRGRGRGEKLQGCSGEYPGTDDRTVGTL
jgi:hypothetical protein